MFEEFSSIIRQKYPDLNIEGDNFPPPPYKAMFAQFLGVAKLAVLGAILFGYDPFPTLGIQVSVK